MQQEQKSLPAKITAPRPKGAFVRRRLHETLDAAGKASVTWVAGPPGSGKTTLVSTYLRKKSCTVLWYRIDEGDADIANFFYYLALAAGAAANGSGAGLPVFSAVYAEDQLTFSRRFFEQLFDLLPGPFALVFDNYQRVAEDPRVEALMECAVEALPDTGQLFVLSRTLPSRAFGRLIVNEDLKLIGWQDLKLDTREIEGIASSRVAEQLSPADLRLLQTRSRGWMAGLILLLETLSTDRAIDGKPERGSVEVLFDYFARELFEQQDQDTRELLLQLAVLTVATPDVAEELTANARAGQMLVWLHRNNYFTERHATGSSSYEFHPLFREFLLDRLRMTYSAKDIRHLNRRAARLLEDRNQFEVAIDHYCLARDWEAAARLICAHAGDMERQGRANTLSTLR